MDGTKRKGTIRKKMKQNNLTNYHSHSLYCDGHAPIDKFLQEAVRQGFTSYGVSPHAPLPWATRWSMLECELPVYLYEMETYKQKYKGIMEIYTGLEIDYIDDKLNPQRNIFQNKRIDYKIGSIHMLYNDKNELIDIDLSAEKFKKVLAIKFNNDVEGLIENYFSKTCRMLECGGFDIVGHMDKIHYNVEQCKTGITQGELYQNWLDKAFTLAKEKNYIIEVNTKAYERLGVTYVSEANYNKIKDYDLKIVVNSDSHYPNLINLGRTETLAKLKNCGIDKVMQLHDGKWIEVENNIG